MLKVALSTSEFDKSYLQDHNVDSTLDGDNYAARPNLSESTSNGIIYLRDKGTRRLKLYQLQDLKS